MIGRLVILSGPSGVGKDTVLDLWMAKNPKVKRVVACTTRPMREGEKQGIDYDFRTRQEFLECAEMGRFLEYKEVHGHLYGTPISGVEEIMNHGGIAVLKIDVQGALEVISSRPEATSIFLMPPTVEELDRRIRVRGSESEDVIQLRLQNAQREIEMAHRYQYQIINQNINQTVEQLEKIVSL